MKENTNVTKDAILDEIEEPLKENLKDIELAHDLALLFAETTVTEEDMILINEIVKGCNSQRKMLEMVFRLGISAGIKSLKGPCQ